MRRLVIPFAVAASLLAMSLPAAAAVLSATPSTIAGATFSGGPAPAGAPLGVSPEVFFDQPTATYYLITTSQPPTEYSSKDGVNWTPVGNTLPQGIDWSIVQEGPNNYRLYYAEFVPGAPGSAPPPPCTPGTKRLRYATSSDLRTWTTQPGVLLADVGCGVPHVMKTSKGQYFLYFNAKNPVHGVNIATSSDGLSWSVRPGIAANNSTLVDPAPIEMPDGTFLMIGSSTGGPGQFQELQILSSPDALTWTQRSRPLYSASGASALDPSVELINGEVKVWFGYAPGGDHNNSRISSGVVNLGSASTSPTSTSSSASKPTASKAKAGAKCTKKGAKAGTLVCVSSKAGLVWKKR